MPLGAAQSGAPDTDTTAEPLGPTKPRQSVRKRVLSQRAIAAGTISVETDHALENSEGEHVEEQDEPDQAPANPDPCTTKRAKHGRKTKMTELNEFALLLMDMFKKEIRKEIEPLKEQITSQRGEIALQSEKITSQQGEIAAQREEIAAQRKEIDELRKELRQLVTNYSPATRSYASVAAPGPASRPPSHPSSHLLSPTIAVTPPNSSPTLSSISNPSPARTAARAKHRLPCVELNLGDTQVNEETAQELQALMNRALRATAELTQTKCNAVIGRRRERVGFIFANEEQAEIVRNKEPWKNLTEKDFTQAKLIKQEKFKVKLTGVDKHAVGNPGRGEAIAQTVLDQINHENGLAIQTMRLLSQPSDRQTVQLVLVCTSQEEKDSVLSKGYIAIYGALARTSEFFESQTLQCKKCGEFNHMARNCGNQERCLNCNEQDHNADSCTNAPRCCNCLGNHHSQTPSCPVRQRQIQRRRDHEW